MFKGLILDKECKPSCNQPVPLILVPLITDWKFKQLAVLLSDGYSISDRVIFPLKAFSYDGTSTPKEIHTSTYRNKNSPESEHFVWSDDLVKAFSDFIDDHFSREEAYEAGAKLIWAPDISSITAQLKNCPDFNLILPKSLQNQSKTRQMYNDWCVKRQALIDSNNQKYFKGEGNKQVNEIAIAREIKKDIGSEHSIEHIRGTLRKYCK